MYEKYTGLPDTAKDHIRTDGRRPVSAGADRRGSGDSARGGSVRGNGHAQGAGRFEFDNEIRHSASGTSGASLSRSGGDTRHAPRQTSSRKRKKLRRRRMITLILSGVLLALLVGAIVMIVKSCQEPVVIDEATDAFRSGVYINGADVSGKTIDEVRAQLETNEQYAINNIAITLKGDGFSKTITGMDMDAESNLDEVMRTALAGTANQVYYTQISIDDAALAVRIDEINQTLTSPPTDASFTVQFSDSGKPEFQYVDGTPGYGIDVQATKKLVHDALNQQQYQTVIEPQITVVQPSITIEDVKAHTTCIGTYATTYDYKGTADDTEEQREVMIPNRAFNVKKTVDAINNQVVKPGETWSFNDVVGDRTEKNGWKLANGILGGDRFTKQFGGGVCQVSTTLYNALLECYPSIKIVERRKHTIPSTYVDKGLDATVDTNHIDFRFKNTSDYPLYIFSYITRNKRSSSRKNDVNVAIYGEALPTGVTYQTRTELIEETLPGEPVIVEDRKMYVGEETITAEARSRYVINVYIERYENGSVVGSELMYMDVYEGNPEKKRVGTKATPTPVPTVTPKPAEPTATPTGTTSLEDMP